MLSTESIISDVLRSEALPERLASALAAGCRGARARVRMSPELSYGRHAGPAPHSARRAAVMLLLFRRDGQWRLPLTLRPATLARHGGQVSLPGGAIEAGESSQDAALRELYEELGFENTPEVLGRLADCYVFASDFLVTPWLGATRAEPQWRPQDAEVEGVVELPLERLLDPAIEGRMRFKRGPLVFHAPCLCVGEVNVWGATCVILEQLREILKSLSEVRP